MEPNRIAYSPIIRRPRLQWPRGARVALWLVPNVEHYEYLPRKGQMCDPWPRTPHPDVLGYSRADPAIFVSGGTEHQCAPGEAPIAAIVRV